MKLSSLFAKPLRQKPSDADTKNHELLVQAGYVRRLMAGVYSYLPLGLRVIDKISAIIKEEMDKIGGQEVSLPALHPAKLWQKTGGWDSIDVLFKIKSRTQREYALGQSHEEVVTPLVKEFVQSYKNLPLSVYQVQLKFRDELRSKSGIMRGREFLMKDMYSFHADHSDFENFYQTVKEAYLTIFNRLSLDAKVTEASGGSFSDKVSYEFMVLTDAGEDDILYCPGCAFCVNVEIAKNQPQDNCPQCQKQMLKQTRAAEVGNVFDLGQKYARDFGWQYTDKDGNTAYPFMGCYGIGISRSMGVIVEKHHDDKGVIWPQSVAPYQVHLVSLTGSEDRAETIYQQLTDQGIEVLWDDRQESAGVKFGDADLLGMPTRLVVSDRTKDKIEWKERSQDQTQLLDLPEVMERLKNQSK